MSNTDVETGPPYPPAPVWNSNEIGEAVIGVSPIGTIIPFNFWLTIISQYANSPVITTLISNFDQYLDQTANFEAFYDNIWNIQTAQGIGLDIWGLIVGVQRTLNVETTRFFGFEEQEGTTDPFNTSPFYLGEPDTTNYQLSDQSFRQLILAKAYANICDNSIPSINYLLMFLFPNRGNAYCTDGGDMTMTYTFDFPLSAVELAIVTQSGVLPKPCGVVATVVQNG